MAKGRPASHVTRVTKNFRMGEYELFRSYIGTAINPNSQALEANPATAVLGFDCTKWGSALLLVEFAITGGGTARWRSIDLELLRKTVVPGVPHTVWSSDGFHTINLEGGELSYGTRMFELDSYGSEVYPVVRSIQMLGASVSATVDLTVNFYLSRV